MMRIWFVDAFADRVFTGAAAAVVPLQAWLSDDILQAIAAENRVSETAFFVSTGLKGNYQLRWFTPLTEVPLCGHATLAAGAVLLTEIERDLEIVVFDTQAGPLVVRETPEGFTLDLPRRVRSPWSPPQELVAGLGAGARVVDGFTGEYANIVLDSETAVRNLKPDMRALERCVRGPRVGCLAVTALADEDKGYDFVARFFAPGMGLNEDPVSGSSFADLTPYWCDRLDREGVTGFQASKRGGYMRGLQTLSSSRLLGKVAVYLRGELDPSVGRLGGRPLRARPIVDTTTPVAPVIPAAHATRQNMVAHHGEWETRDAGVNLEIESEGEAPAMIYAAAQDVVPPARLAGAEPLTRPALAHERIVILDTDEAANDKGGAERATR
jgi:predicted PhzF superfamily epimerase YddE/YHI9